MKPATWQRVAFYAAALVIAIAGAVSTCDNAVPGADVALGAASWRPLVNHEQFR